MSAEQDSIDLDNVKVSDNDNDNDSDNDEFMPDRSDTMSDKAAKPSTLAISGLDLLDSDED